MCLLPGCTSSTTTIGHGHRPKIPDGIVPCRVLGFSTDTITGSREEPLEEHRSGSLSYRPLRRSGGSVPEGKS